MSLRAFIALDLDQAAYQRLIDLIGSLQKDLPGVRWVRSQGLHLTLRFLGWTEEPVLQRVEQRLAPAAQSCAPADVELGGLGMFPERGSPRVLWVDVPLPERLLKLQGECESAAVAEGFEPEERRFTPHLTLGRWKDRARRPQLPAVRLGRARLTRLVLFRSDLKRGGAVYTPVRVFELGK